MFLPSVPRLLLSGGASKHNLNPETRRRIIAKPSSPAPAVSQVAVRSSPEQSSLLPAQREPRQVAASRQPFTTGRPLFSG